MSESEHKAVFLSYASQDTEVAKRLCDALRAAGVEVWFDQNELRGGEAWDAKIKKQIRECTLFLPVISANTQARPEGYFRLEWHLAEQRSLLIARGRPFLVPVSLDGTPERDALVPEAFLAVQWTRLSGEAIDPALVAQVQRLLTVSATPMGTGSRAAPATAVVHASPPVIPDFELLREIGKGAYGDVWLARGLTGVYRAIKIVWRDRFNRAEPFEREFHGLKKFSAMSLPEANQLALLHVGQNTAAGYFYYVMELADDVATGREVNPAQYVPLTLREVRVRRGRLSAAECVAFGIALARALAGLHERGLVHRDIKPSNIILVGGVAKLADIGLVVEAAEALSYVGTEGFVPPEGPGRPSADVFALGKLLYELATGLDREEFPRLPTDLGRESERKLFFRLNDILLRACDPDPTKRYPDARALLADLSKLGATRTSGEAESAPPAVSHSWPKTILALAGMAIGLAFAWRSVWGPARRPEPPPPPVPAVTAPSAPSPRPSSAKAMADKSEDGSGTNSAPEPKSIAVLAFANLSDDKNNEYFSDGISEELLNVVAKIPGLKVTARTSAFFFKGKDVPMAEIARQLGVAYVVEGSVRKQGSTVRITAQLIKAADGFQVWGDTFTRELKDIFVVQDEIAGLVAKNLKVKLGVKSAPRTVNPEAYALFLQGRAVLHRGVPEDYPKAVELFKESLAIDGESALTWAWLANAYGTSVTQAGYSTEEGYNLAKQTARHALELDPDLAMGYEMLGNYVLFADWDWAAADVSLRHALALEPGNAGALSHAANLALILGQTERALDLARQGVDLDPLNYLPAYMLGKVYFKNRSYGEVEQLAERMIRINPEGRYGHVFLVYARLLQGRLEGLESEIERIKSPGFQLTCLALLRHAQGRKAESDAALEEMKSKSAADYSYQIAAVYGYRGDVDQAFEWLEHAYRARDAGLTWIMNDPFLDSLGGDPRWKVFLAKMHLTEPPSSTPANIAVPPSSLPGNEKLAVTRPVDEKSIAVLAFNNLSDDKNNEYFSDGISEELLNVLAKIPELKVSARTSAFYFKGREVPIPEIALRLGVAYVVEGSVRKVGNQVRITAQLIKAADGFHVWSETFTRDLKDIFALQDEIAGLIAENLSLKLGMEARSSGKTVDPEAYRLVLLGRSLVYRGNPGDSSQALIYFQQAIDRDDKFALAWAWIAIAHWQKSGDADEPYDTGFAAAKVAARRALELDPNLSTAHAALGLFYYGYEWDWAQARASFQRAVDLAPGDAARMSNLSRLASTLGQSDKAVKVGRRSVELDPLNGGAQSALCVAYFLGGRLAELEAQVTQWLQFSEAGNRYRVLALLLTGRKEEALKVAGQVPLERTKLFSLALTHWSLGHISEANANLEQLKNQYAGSMAYQVAETYAWRGETDLAFEWLENGYRQRDTGMIWLKNDPLLKSLHQDRRWDVLLHKMNLAVDQLK